jgi:hypothetical protein
MYHWMGDWGWFWMTLMLVFWILALGVIVYVAARLANRPPDDPKRDET